MKETNKASRITGYLEKIFRILNKELFDNKLPEPFITIISNRKSYGHITIQKVWVTKTEQKYELNISSYWFNRNIEDIVATMIHEMVHEFCLENNIQDTSRNGMYHNKKFKAEAEKRGLIISHNETIGYSVTEPSDSIINLCIQYDLVNIDAICKICDDFTLFPPNSDNGDNPNTLTPISDNGNHQTKKGNSFKYCCKNCNLIVRASKIIDGRIKCVNCDSIMVRDD